MDATNEQLKTELTAAWNIFYSTRVMPIVSEMIEQAEHRGQPYDVSQLDAYVQAAVNRLARTQDGGTVVNFLRRTYPMISGKDFRY